MFRRNVRAARMLSDEDADAVDDLITDEPADSADATTEADYAFEGYSVDFIDKVALIPPVSAAQSRRRAGRG
jgi:hypothetical protein